MNWCIIVRPKYTAEFIQSHIEFSNVPESQTPFGYDP